MPGQRPASPCARASATRSLIGAGPPPLINTITARWPVGSTKSRLRNPFVHTTFREHFVSLIPKRVPAEHLIGALRRSDAGRKSCERTPLSAACPRPSQPLQIPACPAAVDSMAAGSRHRVKVPPGHGSERLTVSGGASGAPLLVHDDTRIPHSQWAEHAACQERLRRTGLPWWPMRARAVPCPRSNTRTVYRDHAAVSNRRGTRADRRHDIRRTGRPGSAGRGRWGRAATPTCELPSRRV